MSCGQLSGNYRKLGRRTQTFLVPASDSSLRYPFLLQTDLSISLITKPENFSLPELSVMAKLFWLTALTCPACRWHLGHGGVWVCPSGMSRHFLHLPLCHTRDNTDFYYSSTTNTGHFSFQKCYAELSDTRTQIPPPIINTCCFRKNIGDWWKGSNIPQYLL